MCSVNPELRFAGDEFVDLTEHLMRAWGYDKAELKREVEQATQQVEEAASAPDESPDSRQ